jgi:hypothetical protein
LLVGNHFDNKSTFRAFAAENDFNLSKSELKEAYSIERAKWMEKCNGEIQSSRIELKMGIFGICKEANKFIGHK